MKRTTFAMSQLLAQSRIFISVDQDRGGIEMKFHNLKVALLRFFRLNKMLEEEE